MQLAPGMQITPQVRLVSELSKGNMGAVWVADHLGMRRQVAVKFIKGKPDSETLARFKREADSAKQIRSPHVVKIFESGAPRAGTPNIEMELLQGESLAARLERQGRFGW